MGGSQVGACALREPTDGADNALIFLFAIEERLGRFVFVGLGTGVDGETGTIWRSVVGNVTKMNIVRFNKVRSKSCLAEMNLNEIRHDHPLKVRA